MLRPIGMTLEFTEIEPSATRIFSRVCAEPICGRNKTIITSKNLKRITPSSFLLLLSPMACRLLNWLLSASRLSPHAKSLFFVLFFELRHHRRIRERRRVAQRAAVSDVSQQAAHDFATARLRHSAAKRISSGRAIEPIFSPREPSAHQSRRRCRRSPD